MGTFLSSPQGDILTESRHRDALVIDNGGFFRDALAGGVFGFGELHFGDAIVTRLELGD